VEVSNLNAGGMYSNQYSLEDKLQPRLDIFEAHKSDAEMRANGV
jgi:hypothetical protein